MISYRDIARELLPYVVMFWATFALLGGALEHTQYLGPEHAGHGMSGLQAGASICVITVAYVAQAATSRIRPKLHSIFKLAYIRAAYNARANRLESYYWPPPYPPSLERLQIRRA